MDWQQEISEQLSWHWDHQLRPRLVGLTDAEYFWEPAPDTWSVRGARRRLKCRPGSGDFTIDFGFPNPTPRRLPPSPGGWGTSSSACSEPGSATTSGSLDRLRVLRLRRYGSAGP